MLVTTVPGFAKPMVAKPIAFVRGVREPVHILALVGDSPMYGWLFSSGESGPNVTRVASWTELHSSVRARLLRAVIVDPYFGGSLSLGRLEVFRTSFPYTPVLALARFGETAPQDILELGRVGVTRAVDLEECRTLANLDLVVRTTSSGEACDCFLRCCNITKHEGVRHLIARFFATPTSIRNSTELAAAYGRHAKTLRLHLLEEGLPGPERLIAWIRIVTAASLLREPERSTRAVATAAGLHCESDLRGLVRRYMGCGLRGIMGPRALATVCDAFCLDRKAERVGPTDA